VPPPEIAASKRSYSSGSDRVREPAGSGRLRERRAPRRVRRRTRRAPVQRGPRRGPSGLPDLRRVSTPTVVRSRPEGIDRVRRTIRPDGYSPESSAVDCRV